jgi:hypothetical protein
MPGYFESGVTVASKCADNCASCASLDICYTCNEGYETYIGKCVPTQSGNLNTNDGGR